MPGVGIAMGSTFADSCIWPRSEGCVAPDSALIASLDRCAAASASHLPVEAALSWLKDLGGRTPSGRRGGSPRAKGEKKARHPNSLGEFQHPPQARFSIHQTRGSRAD